MKRRKVLLTLLGIGLAVFAIGSLTGNPAQANNPLSVTVTNTPLPVQGSVSVGNTPSVNVANTSLAINNALDSNNNPIPLSVTPQGQPYQDSCEFNPGSCPLHDVPSNMRLVIQEVDMQVEQLAAGLGPVFYGQLSVTLNNSAVGHFLALTNEGSDTIGDVFLVTHQATTLYAGPNTPLTCSVNESDAEVRCAISGYLVPSQ